MRESAFLAIQDLHREVAGRGAIVVGGMLAQEREVVVGCRAQGDAMPETCDHWPCSLPGH